MLLSRPPWGSVSLPSAWHGPRDGTVPGTVPRKVEGCLPGQHNPQRARPSATACGPKPASVWADLAWAERAPVSPQPAAWRGKLAVP